VTPDRWRQIKADLDELVGMEPRSRHARIAEFAATDPDLGRELESLLAAHERAGESFLEESAAAGAAARSDPGSPEPRVGRHIGPYELLEQIGSGGMGEVYKARRADDEYQRLVAIKLIRIGLDSVYVIHQFRHERQILASFDHPNIGRLLDGGSTADGSPYLVMELIDGERIDRYCDRLRLDTTARLRLFLQVCGAVQYAHQHLIIHRDLKPNNILVDRDGVPKLVDFGIAKILEPRDAPGSVEHTRSVLRALTPDYASPEQIRGQQITTASDIYSLGVILHELLTGCKPPAAATTQSPYALARLTEPRRPSQVARRGPSAIGERGTDVAEDPNSRSAVRDGSPERLQRRLRGDLDNIVLMSLEHDPRRRYDSVEQLAEDVRRHLSSRPVLARKDTFGYRTTKFISRYAAGLTAAGLVAIALLVGLGAALREAQIARMERERAERRYTDVRQLAHSLIFDVHDSIRDLPGSTAAKQQIVQTALQYLDGLSKEAEGDSALQKELAAGYQRLGDVQGLALGASSGDSAAAAASYQHALAFRRAVVAASPNDLEAQRDLVMTAIKLSEFFWLSGDAKDSLTLSQEAVETGERLIRRDAHDSVAQATLARGLLSYGYHLFKLQGDAPKGLGKIRSALELLESLWKADPSDQGVGRSLSLAYTRAAEILSHDKATFAEAVLLYEKAESVLADLSKASPNNSDLKHLHAFSEFGIANTLIEITSVDAAGRTAEAVAAILDDATRHDQRALDELRALSAGDPGVAQYHTDVAFILSRMAHIANDRNRPNDAAQFVSEGLKGLERISTPPPNDYSNYVHYSLYEEFARSLAGRAADPKLPIAERRAEWRLARDRYSQALSVIARVKTAEANAEADFVKSQIQGCEKSLEELARRNRP
jgi:non-specific serine/threonine protein kinase/serine/threonine-protein kinase